MGTTEEKIKSTLRRLKQSNPSKNIQPNGLDKIMQKCTDQHSILCKSAQTKMLMRLHIQYLIG